MTATELRARLGEALNRASGGERILIERDHRPLAVLVSPEEAARLDDTSAQRAERGRATLDELAAFRARIARELSHAPTHGRKAGRHPARLIRNERDKGHGDHG